MTPWHWILKQKLSATEKLTALAILAHQNGAKQSWPSIRLLSELTSSGPRTINRALRKLETAGVLVKKKRPGHSSLYSIDRQLELFARPRYRYATVAYPVRHNGAQNPSIELRATPPLPPPRGETLRHRARNQARVGSGPQARGKIKTWAVERARTRGII